MRAEPRFKNPVVLAVVSHLVVFLACLAATFVLARSLQQSVVIAMAMIVLPATVIVLISLGLLMAAMKRRARHLQVRSENPGAVVIPAEWNAAVLAPFTKEASSAPSDYRGFGVEIAADEHGISIWRGPVHGRVLLLGKLSWSQIHSVRSGTVKAVIGSRVAPTVRILVRPCVESPFVDEIELIVRAIPIREALSALRPPSR